MTPEQWQRVRDLFEAVVDLPPAEAEAMLARDAQQATAAEVRSLLAAHGRAGAFLGAPVSDRVPALLTDDARFADGDMVGSYRVKRELGRGGMGRVYLASDTRLGRDVALKVLPPNLVRDPAQRERLRREARAAASLTHSGICTVFALEEIADDVLIASEYVDGETLREEIERGPVPSAESVLRLARDLAITLDAAHRRGITHRDLKPENVMRARDGVLKVLDFGLALMAVEQDGLGSPRVTNPGVLVGTPAYMAPEQLTIGHADARTDLFALGVLLYEFATGQHPFAASSPLALAARIIEGAHRPLAERRPDLAPALVVAVERCLMKRADQRYASAAELLSAVQSPAEARPRSAACSAVGWWRAHLWVVTALYVVATVCAWGVKEWGHGLADAGFIMLAMLAVVGGILRGHLLFVERNHDAALFAAALRRAGPALNSVDLTLAAILLVEGLLVARTRAVAGVLIVGLGIGIALARVVLEHSTTSAAFERPVDEGHS